MKKPVKFVYESTVNCENHMELMNSLRAYVRRCQKAYDKNDRETLETCCNAIDLIVEKLSEMSLAFIQLERVNKCACQVKEYREFLKEA